MDADDRIWAGGAFVLLKVLKSRGFRNTLRVVCGFDLLGFVLSGGSGVLSCHDFVVEKSFSMPSLVLEGHRLK